MNGATSILLLLALTLSAQGCVQPRVEPKLRHHTEYTCTDEARAEASKWTLECIKNANPRSDEEPEDWLPLCEKMAVRRSCTEYRRTYVYSSQEGYEYCDEIAKSSPNRHLCPTP